MRDLTIAADAPPCVPQL